MRCKTGESDRMMAVAILRHIIQKQANFTQVVDVAHHLLGYATMNDIDALVREAVRNDMELYEGLMRRTGGFTE